MAGPPPGMSDEQFNQYMKWVRSQAGSGGGATGNLDVTTLNDRFKTVGQEAVKLGKSFFKLSRGLP